MVAIYARQSIDKRDSISIESQIEFCRTKLISNECYTVYADRGFSGKNTMRPKFAEMMNVIRAGVIRKVVIYKLDRISRTLIDFANMLEIFDKYSVSIISCSDPIDTTTPMGRAMINVAMIFAQLERETIQERVKDNYYARGKDGFYLGGTAPFGFRKIETTHNDKKTYTFEPDGDSAELVKQLFVEYATTDVALGVICGRLNKSKVFTNRENPWTGVSLGRLLRNPAYVMADADVYMYLKNKRATMNNDVDDYIGENGCYLYGERKSVTTSKFTNISTCFVTLALHRGLIDSETWIACQNKLDKNRQLKNSGKGTHTWLTGLLKCGYCKMGISVVNGYKDKKYITCGGRKQKVCYDRKKAYLIEDIELAVKGLLLGEAESIMHSQQAHIVNGLGKVELIKAKIRLAKIEESISLLIEKVLCANNATMHYINSSVDNLDKEKMELLRTIESEKSTTGKAEPEIDLRQAIVDWDLLDFDMRKHIASILIHSVIVFDDRLEIEFANKKKVIVGCRN